MFNTEKINKLIREKNQLFDELNTSKFHVARLNEQVKGLLSENTLLRTQYNGLAALLDRIKMPSRFVMVIEQAKPKRKRHA